MKIKGGYILQPRVLDFGSISNRPPVERELWAYILRNVNHKDTNLCKRGTGFFQLTQIAEDLSWYVGARKMKYKIPAISKALRRLCEGNATETMRATRGVFITVCNYDYYQDPSNYEGNDERFSKDLRRQSDKQECKENTTNVVLIESDIITNNIKLDTKTCAHKKSETEHNWRTDFEIYKSLVREAYLKIKNDKTTIQQQQEFNPGIDIIKTLEKACINFWATESGWKHKKKGKGNDIDMYQTLINALSQKQNKVYYERINKTERQEREHNRLEEEARAAWARLTGQQHIDNLTSDSINNEGEYIDWVEV